MYLDPHFAHSSFGFARNLDTFGHLSSPFFIHVIQIYVTRGRISVTCNSTWRSFFIRFINACYMLRLLGPFSHIEIHDCKLTMTRVCMFI